MLYLIGLGLGDAKDITVKGLEIVRKCDKVYLENYTSILSCGKEKLEEFYGRELILADRDTVEMSGDEIISSAKEENVAMLVVGDPFGATTHTDFILRAKERNIPCQVIHNASIMNAVACCGLQLYSFGETVSIPYWTDSWRPDSFFEKILKNRRMELHTLCLLDIRVHEPTVESLTKKKREYDPPRFMSVAEACQQLLDIVKEKPDDVAEDSLVVGLARVGHETQEIFVSSLKEMARKDLGPPLHSLVIPAKNLHPLESEYLQQFTSKKL
ncbi:diphthine methyl ester synthase [Phlebotomus argentipes]|uniref:diphthine methyl ester synthase n=1 Tax=Phlebotomus argentipes TaxID=94469 RepID=UPI0028931A22|nr:diphthine methyl ester synthase [Phlebotomus argentipes]